jgi:hypothetical protein
MGAAASREVDEEKRQVTRRMSRLCIQDKVYVEGDDTPNDARMSKYALLSAVDAETTQLPLTKSEIGQQRYPFHKQSIGKRSCCRIPRYSVQNSSAILLLLTLCF